MPGAGQGLKFCSGSKNGEKGVAISAGRLKNFSGKLGGKKLPVEHCAVVLFDVPLGTGIAFFQTISGEKPFLPDRSDQNFVCWNGQTGCFAGRVLLEVRNLREAADYYGDFSQINCRKLVKKAQDFLKKSGNILKQ